MTPNTTDSADQALSCDLTVTVSLACYERDVIYRTCYAYTDRAYIWLEPGPDGNILVRLTRKAADVDLAVLHGEFCNALLDYALRKQIAVETGGVRDALFRAAFGGIAP